MQQQKTNTGVKDYVYLLLEDTWSEFVGRMWPEQFLDEQVAFLCIYYVAGTTGIALHKDTEVLDSK